MSAIFTIFLIQVFAPIVIVFGIAGAFVSRSWWHVLITALAAATTSEVFASLANDDNIFNSVNFLIGVVAAGLWAAWFYWLRLAKRNNK